MAQDSTGALAPKKMTAAEMQQWIETHEEQLSKYAASHNPLLALRDITKSSSINKRIDSITKDRIVTFLQNPSVNENNIRNASWYIYYRNQIYQRIIHYFSTLFCLEARSVIPTYDLVNPDSDDKILKSYNDTVKLINKWNIQNEFLKVIKTCFIQDVSYNIAYYDETGLFFLALPPEYCRIYGQYPTGDFAFSISMDYFTGQRAYLLEEWGEPFTSMWREYERQGKTIKARWQRVPDEYAACFKYRNDDWATIMPPFSGLLCDLINLNDIGDVQAIADKLEIYKLVYMKLKTLTGTKVPDDYEVSPDVAVEYFNRMVEEALPSYASAAIVPGSEDLGVIDFSSSDKTNETNKVLKATKSVLNTSGGAQILNSAEVSGTTAFKAAILADTEFAISNLLPQIEGWFNRVVGFEVSNPSKIHFYHVGRLNREDVRKELLENAQYSLPTKLAVLALSGLTELDSLSLNHLEDGILKLGDKFVTPLRSSYTSSNNTSGRPKSDDSSLTDDGEASRDKIDNMN